MNRFSNFICKHRKIIIFVYLILLVLSFVGIKLTKVNYDILVYLPEDIETIKGQNILTDDFNMGSYSIAVVENMSSKEILNLEDKIKSVDGVNEAVSLYDVIDTSIPVEMLPSEVADKVHQENTDLLFITFSNSTSSEKTLNAVEEIRNISNDYVKQGGMSSMVLDTMNLSEQEIFVYVVIAVILCIIILELSLDSYIVPFILIANIGFAILFNLGSNVFLGQISYITKALVAVLQLGVTTDFSIFLYNSYEKKKQKYKDKEKAMKEAIKETFTAVTGSSLTTIAGFLVLCTMILTLGKDLGIVMAKGVLLGVICVLTLFPSLLLGFDKLIEKTKHKKITPNFTKFNKFIINHKKIIFALFIILFVPIFLAYSKVDVYYKLDKSLPSTLESISTNEVLKDKYNIVSPEIILLNKNLKNDDVTNITKKIEQTDGIEWSLSLSKLKQMGITEQMLPKDFVSLIKNENYQVVLVNSSYETATDELNKQIKEVNNIVKEYDDDAIVAGEGPLMKDLVNICHIDFKNVNTLSIVCIFIILFFILKSFSLPLLLISVIEFAIFANMSFSYFNGTVLPFIAPIVLGTIQLGATIDYAILLTTTYLRKRKEKIPKNKAMLETLNYTGNSILISGMCFFAATFGVGVYSKIEMIGSLCALIARGAIISMLVVIMVLPSILLIFDKLIMKTTFNKKEGKNMRKNKNNKTKKLVMMFIITGLLISPISVFALTKNETVYTKLNENGKVKSTIVNEQLINSAKSDTLEDYTELKNILNVGNDNTYKKYSNKLIWNALGKDIFYQGTTNKKLPVNVDITYKLNGKEKKVSEMLGKSGKVTITLKYKNIDKHIVTLNNKEEEIYTPFVVTFATVLSNETDTNIKITNGKIVTNGNKNVVIALATPGLYESLQLDELKKMNNITLSYETTKFSLSSIYNIVTPKLIESDDLKVFNKMDSIYEETDSLQKNMNKIDDGAKEVSKGSAKLKQSLSAAIKKIENDNSSALSERQVNEIRESAVSEIKNTFTDNYKESIADTAWKQVQMKLSPDDEEVKKYVTSSVTNIMSSYLGENITLYGGCLKGNNDACNLLSSKGVDINKALAFQEEVTNQIANTATQTSLYVAENTSKQVATSVSEKVATEVASNVAEAIAPTVANQVKSASLDVLKGALNNLYGGVVKLDNGINNLSSGVSTFNKEGINKISDMVNGDLKIKEDKMKQLTKLSDEYNSFTTNNNLKNSETKFILVIDGQSVPKEKSDKKVENTKTTFWDRIKNLFK